MILIEFVHNEPMLALGMWLFAVLAVEAVTCAAEDVARRWAP